MTSQQIEALRARSRAYRDGWQDGFNRASEACEGAIEDHFAREPAAEPIASEPVQADLLQLAGLNADSDHRIGGKTAMELAAWFVSEYPTGMLAFSSVNSMAVLRVAVHEEQQAHAGQYVKVIRENIASLIAYVATMERRRCVGQVPQPVESGGSPADAPRRR